ncbi:Scr1 family TA system antitoxin-like transcriptional regulator [Streptomyces sp. NPDC018057]|uniref:Scr1 family TA system antitoxin-like transcriptional regulator n=1 Tax=unclassified Streptomyces TaxID=2593676 RepID=UPI0037BD960C
MRGQAGLSGDRLAARRNMSQSKVSRIENGRTRPYLVDVEQILRALDAPPALVAEVSALARMANTEWRSLRELRRKGLGTRQAELKSLEASSTRMRYFLLSMATGLLATPEYVRASLAHSTADTSKAVAGKLRRQAVLYDASKRFTFVLTERAVRWPVVSPLALAEQMDRLASLSHLPNVQIGVIPPGCPSSLGMWLARVPWSNCTFDSSWLMQALIDSKYAEVTAAGLAANELIETCAALTKINREITEAQRSECLTHLSALKSLYTRRNQLIHGLWAPAGMRTDQDEPAPTPHRLAGGPSARRTAAQAPADGFALGLSRYADTVGSPAR